MLKNLDVFDPRIVCLVNEGNLLQYRFQLFYLFQLFIELPLGYFGLAQKSV